MQVFVILKQVRCPLIRIQLINSSTVFSLVKTKQANREIDVVYEFKNRKHVLIFF